MRSSSGAAVLAGLWVALAASTTTSRVLAQAMSTTPELAYDRGEIPTARALAMGGALDALGVSTAALYMNPANMAMARVYHIEALAAFSPEAKRQSYGLAIVDSVLNTGRVAGGVGGTWSILDPSGTHRSWTDLRSALALPLGDHFALGATGRWLRVDQSVGAGPFGHSLASDGSSDGPLLNALTFDVGATAAIGDALRVGLAGHNLTNPGTALAPTLVSGGIAYGSHEFSVEVDELLDFTTYGSVRGRFMAGAELFLADRYAVRAGWRYDGGTLVHAASLGFGYVDPRWSVEVGVRRDLISDHASTFGVLSLRYFYDATNSTTPADEPDMQ